MRTQSFTRLLFFALLLCFAGTACQQPESDTLVVYSGRSKALVETLVERFQEATGVPVEVRYGSDAELLATLEEEGERSPADVFWANTTGALGALSNAGRLTALPDSILQRPAAFVPSSGLWTPVTTRFRVLAYHAGVVDSTALPASVMDLPNLSQFQGRIGWTPTYSSFQDFITAMRVIHGEDTTRAWLEGMQALAPNAYPSNTPMLQALAAGEIDLALTNHYYVHRLNEGGAEGEHEDDEDEGEDHEDEGEEAEAGQPGATVRTYYFAPGDVGNLALVTGAGLLQNSTKQNAALQFLRYLLSPEAQAYAAESVHEYPVVRGATLPDYLLPVDASLRLSPPFDFDQLRDLDATLALLREAGIL